MAYCMDCDRSFKHERALQQHLRDSSAHTVDYDCDKCNRSFNSQAALEQHVRDSPSHTVSHDCGQCDRLFSSDEGLQQHLRDSSAHAVSFNCDDCDRTFVSEEALHQHLQDSPVHHRSSPIDTFFASYADFDYDPQAVPSDEMTRLRRHYGWEQRDPEGARAWDDYRQALVSEFESWYGTEDNKLGVWRGLCRALRVDPLPSSCAGCRRAVKGRHVNMVDLLHHRRGGSDAVRIFATLEELREYTNENRRYFPKDTLNPGALLENLLRHIFTAV